MVNVQTYYHLSQTFGTFGNSTHRHQLPKSFFARNRDIVDETDMLIATLATKKETGGTWYTINYSRKQKKHRVIVYPDGSIGE
jgi:hypothetical protein